MKMFPEGAALEYLPAIIILVKLSFTASILSSSIHRPSDTRAAPLANITFQTLPKVKKEA